MNKKIIAAAIFAIAASINAQAQIYAGATVGVSSYNVDCSGLTECKTKGTAFKVLAGYQVTPLFGLEASYFDLGHASAKERDVTFKGGATGVDFAAVLRMQLNQDFGLFSRFGVAKIESTESATFNTLSFTRKYSSTQPVFGIGATYQINKTLRVRTEIEARRAKVAENSDNLKGTSYSIGLENAF